jgi:hypothetical protein
MKKRAMAPRRGQEETLVCNMMQKVTEMRPLLNVVEELVVVVVVVVSGVLCNRETRSRRAT